MKRLCRSKLFSVTAIVSLGIATLGVASAQNRNGSVGARTPDNPTTTARIPSYYSSANAQAPQTGQARAQFEGPAMTDYFNFEQNFLNPANPDLAVGPEDVVMIVNKQIFRVPNANAPAINPPPQNPFATGSPVAQKAFLDVWLGETALNALCPTQPRTSQSCLFENSNVKYDQMHGRFVVLFTVTDTGLTAV